jgi:hypothetical protein
MSARPVDTSVASWRVQQDVIARMEPNARVKVAFELSDWVRESQIQGMLARNPGWNRHDAAHAVAKRVVEQRTKIR